MTTSFQISYITKERKNKYASYGYDESLLNTSLKINFIRNISISFKKYTEKLFCIFEEHPMQLFL